MLVSYVYVKILFLLLVIFYVESYHNDRKCAARSFFNRSVVCVCNATYCDDVTREEVACGQYIWYTSSEAGLRFDKFTSRLENFIPSAQSSYTTLDLNVNTKYQTVEGFGGAVSDAVGINWQNLTDPQLKQNLIDTYFGDKGLQYSMLRVPIAASDFSTHVYAYNEYPENDYELSNYSLSYEDYQYKIPFIKAALAVAKTPIHIIATVWSPPKWMKNSHEYTGVSRLKKEFFQTYADYYKKFIEKYSEEGIPIWGITTTNEPLEGILLIVPFNSLGWTSLSMGTWIKENLGPTIKNWRPDIKILAGDDQRPIITFWFEIVYRGEIPFLLPQTLLDRLSTCSLETCSGQSGNPIIDYESMLASAAKVMPEVLQYIDGIAVHGYLDKLVPPDILKRTQELFKNQFIIATEYCEGLLPTDKLKVDLGSWERAVSYTQNILEDLNYNLTGWIDWNLCLNAQGGPNWVKNYVDSPVIVFPERGEFVKQPMFYAMGHFSKFIPRGSRRIQVRELSFTTIDNVAFLTPQNTVVVVLYNDKNESRIVNLILDGKQASVLTEANSITTVEISNGCDSL